MEKTNYGDQAERFKVGSVAAFLCFPQKLPNLALFLQGIPLACVAWHIRSCLRGRAPAFFPEALYPSMGVGGSSI